VAWFATVPSSETQIPGLEKTQAIFFAKCFSETSILMFSAAALADAEIAAPFAGHGK
jgi:hypothetical protein